MAEVGAVAVEGAPVGDPFVGEAAPPPVVEPAPADPAAEPDAQADLSEQEQALIQKLAGPLGDAMVERVNGDQAPAEPDLSSADVVSRLLAGATEDDDDDNFQAPQPYGDQQGQQDPTAEDPVFQHPAVQALLQQSEAVQQYLAHQAQQQQEAALHTLADKNPDLLQPEVLQEVETTARQLAERAGQPELATDPIYVETALRAVRASRATSPEVPADEARTQGASLPTNAGAAVNGEADPKSTYWAGIKGAGGQAFPS